ncbi:unnamed protein product [Vitrella brassicaformis CCMP3155]|uniref:Holocytochrome c-type synthase n=1 Tax=Vitrella brassicaformis (strain CCMP3155) TaxID=1169540 RepID=A0A0G4EBX9_VITBC|nr:unnamed protein product [Vitrella brassicaformis CCMP3155]|mmetsp:Transcript_10554/g.25618  ORF Transcript_10554/g.25618 Transcript_10554/m.25618 type:complete len:253 (-) Transcript_10554:289-1047(-)|eukprot:CEL92815.1 unnamed protein product [Vitrella brassicaformis CCMP3155]
MSCPVQGKEAQAPPSGCPVQHSTTTKTSGCPVQHDAANKPSGCPVQHDAPSAKGDVPADNKERFADHPLATSTPPSSPTTKGPQSEDQLSNDRQKATIPSVSGDWYYPSERQFFKATLAKGHDDVMPSDMPMVVAIHNAVNEQCWQRIMEYEKMHEDECSTPKLLRFIGRPDQMSVKAKLMTALMGYHKPFDRHDWFVDRCGKQVRYVVDFYEGAPSKYSPVSIYVDARPEVGLEGCMDRTKMFLKRTNLIS